ncbi:proteasome assembly chaperone family protein, partial [Leucobacter sp. M11]|uniref:proteasome assembly chaperone family protein n=1 Tax=Leucobacter sp. M11 TaxID=2993565 RepID=UPI002D7F0D49
MSESLFSRAAAGAPELVPSGLPLVIALTGFSDAGGAVAQLEEYFWGNSGLETLVTFDTDELYDYRARRPTIVFNGEHLSDYDAPELALYLAKDDLEHPFLLLMGVEPDFRWEGFVTAVQGLVAEYQVASMTWVHSIPMPVPHTRPTAVTVSGTRLDLIEARSVWKPTTQLSATAGHLLELRLMDRGLAVTGFALLIPHYLAENEYPAALLAALENIMSSTGLILP